MLAPINYSFTIQIVFRLNFFRISYFFVKNTVRIWQGAIGYNNIFNLLATVIYFFRLHKKISLNNNKKTCSCGKKIDDDQWVVKIGRLKYFLFGFTPSKAIKERKKIMSGKLLDVINFPMPTSLLFSSFLIFKINLPFYS